MGEGVAVVSDVSVWYIPYAYHRTLTRNSVCCNLLSGGFMVAFIRRIVDLAVVVKPAIRYKSYRAKANLHHHINMSDAEKRQALEDLLKANSIQYDVVEHPAVSGTLSDFTLYCAQEYKQA